MLDSEGGWGDAVDSPTSDPQDALTAPAAATIPSDVDADPTVLAALPEGTGDLTADEAAYLTEMIRATADMMWVLLSRAHAGRAWIALGYSSFSAYVENEFSISRSRAYQLIQQARVIAALESAAPSGTHVQITEAAARDLRHFVDDLVPAVHSRTEGMSPDAAAAEITAIVDEARSNLPAPGPTADDGASTVSDAPDAQPVSDESGHGPVDAGQAPSEGTDQDASDHGFSGNYDDPPGVPYDRTPPLGGPSSAPVPGYPSAGSGFDPDEDFGPDDDLDNYSPTGDGPGAGGYGAGTLPPPLPAGAEPQPNPVVTDAYAEMDALTDDTVDEDDPDEVNPVLLRRRVQSAYDLYSTLISMADMPEPADIIAIVPVERRLLIDESLDAVIGWLTEFRDQWNAQPWRAGAVPSQGD